MATVHIPSLLRKFTNGEGELQASGRTVGEVIRDLERRYTGLRDQLIRNGELHPSLAVAVDGELSTSGLLEPVGEGSHLHFMPPIGGG